MSTYVYQINGQEILAKRAELSRAGLNIDDTFDAIRREIASVGSYQIVDSMDHGHPDVDKPSHNVIYLYRQPESQAADPYQEWIYDNTDTWQLIGETSMDLTPYATKVDLRTAIEALDATISSTDDQGAAGNIGLQIVETDGKITSITVTKDTTVNISAYNTKMGQLDNSISNLESNKITKVSDPTAGNFPVLTVNGYISNSDYNASSFVAAGDYATDKAAIKQDITDLQNNKANKVSVATAGNIATLSGTGDLVDSGHGLNYLATKGEFDSYVTSNNAEVAKKADKVTNATAGDIATLDTNGNLVDSGTQVADLASKDAFDAYKTSNDAEVAKKANKIADGHYTNNNFVKVVNGGIADSGYKPSDFATSAQGSKADTAIQSVKSNGTALTKDSNNAVDIPAASASAYGVVILGYTEIAESPAGG